MTLLDHVIELKATVAGLGADVQALKVNLLGNGQVGRVGAIEFRVEGVEKNVSTVKKHLNLWRGIIIGIALLGGIISGLRDLPTLISFFRAFP